MRVWIVNPFDNLPQEGNRPQRYYMMARAFAAAGHEVVLWTGDFSHATKAKRRFVREMDDGFGLRLVPTLPYAKNISLARILSHAKLAKDWMRLARREAHKPDLVIASTPPLKLCDAARRFAARTGARFVADIQDAWPETFARILPRWLLAPLKLLARRNYRRADAITAVADLYLDLARSYGATCPMKRVYLGIGSRESSFAKASEDRRGTGNGEQGTEKTPQPSAIVYAGSLGRTYDLATVIRAISAHPDWVLHIAGSGEQEEALKSLAATLGAADRVVFHGYLDETALDGLLARCDIGVVPMAASSFVGVPNKFADYSRAGLAIASSLGGESAALLDRYSAGATYREGDADSLSDTVSSLQKRLADAKFGALELCRREFDADSIYRTYVDFATKI